MRKCLVHINTMRVTLCNKANYNIDLSYLTKFIPKPWQDTLCLDCVSIMFLQSNLANLNTTEDYGALAGYKDADIIPYHLGYYMLK